MADNGIIIIGDQTIGYSERETYVYWDIAADAQSERSIILHPPYYLISNSRHTALNYIHTLYATRWTAMEYTPNPTSDRYVYLHYSLCVKSERTTYYHPETGNRLVFVEGLLTNTPLLMKYPKYYNWNYVPQVLNPEFILWSFYPLATSDITVKLLATNSGSSVVKNSGVDSNDFIIETLSNKQYKITVNIDHTFNPGDTVTCYVTAYDTKGNYLKPGMW